MTHGKHCRIVESLRVHLRKSKLYTSLAIYSTNYNFLHLRTSLDEKGKNPTNVNIITSTANALI